MLNNEVAINVDFMMVEEMCTSAVNDMRYMRKDDWVNRRLMYRNVAYIARQYKKSYGSEMSHIDDFLNMYQSFQDWYEHKRGWPLS